ncbi:MAG: peptide chain release factor N(5)-glutamine methyltransferase [Candidimonas sp.]|nr:MAG: peptide chain release factor N(5)-glutamine methyltransferase [Candidimonas sp.]
MAMAASPRVGELMRASGLPTLEARMLLEHVLAVPRVWLITHDAHVPTARQAERFQTLCERRREGWPMAYLTGHREFMGRDFEVTPSVLIPRPETELLAETAIAELAPRSAPLLLDLGTGSGAIAVSVALACPHARVVATDRSVEALSVARVNARRLRARVTFHEGDWYDALPEGNGDFGLAFDLIVSNPPYVVAGDSHLIRGDLRFEPSAALIGGADGLCALRAIVGGARRWLRRGGRLWVEHGWDQAAAVRGLLHARGFTEVESRRDLAGIERISGGVAAMRPPSNSSFDTEVELP